MASTIRIKRSSVSGNPAVLAAGELAYSGLTDNGSNGGDRLYIGMGTETAGNAANHVVIGGKYFTDQINAATSSNTANTIVRRDASGNISVGTITGTVSGNASTATAWQTARNLSLTGDGTATLSNVDGTANVSAALTLATVNSNVGTFGSSTAIPVVTVNAKGLVTSVTTASISTTLNIAGGTGTDSVELGSDTLTFAGGTGVTTTVTNNQVSFAIGQAVATTSDVTFNNMTLTGYLRGPGTFTIDPSGHGDNTGTVVIAGNLQVDGTTTTINSTQLVVDDLNIVVASGAANAGAANGAGLTVDGANATFTYTSVDDRWNLNKNLNVGTVYGALSGNATTATAWQTARNLSLTGDATATLTGVDGSANVSAAVTLATVNSNVGTFGTSTSVPSFTVNAKGLVTAVTTNAIPTATTSVLGLASFNSAEFTVTSGAVSIAAVDGGTY